MVPQHMKALAYANKIRLKRAEIKRGVFAGQITAVELVRSTPPELSTMTVAELLRSQYRWGRTRSRKLLNQLAISEARTFERLTERQRELIANALQN